MGGDARNRGDVWEIMRRKMDRREEKRGRRDS